MPANSPQASSFPVMFNQFLSKAEQWNALAGMVLLTTDGLQVNML
jgi:hypothetical protein